MRAAGYAVYRLKQYWHFSGAADCSRERFDDVVDFLTDEQVACGSCLLGMCDLCALRKVIIADGWVP